MAISSDNIKGSESFSKQLTQFMVELNSSLWYIIVTIILNSSERSESIKKFERLLCEVAFLILSTITYGLLPRVKYTNNTQLNSPKGNPNKHVFHMPTSLTKDGAYVTRVI